MDAADVRADLPVASPAGDRGAVADAAGVAHPAADVEIQKKLQLKESQNYAIILTVLADEKRYFILAKVL